MAKRLQVGAMIHGFANGYFGRDSYRCRRIEAKGHDWIVTRSLNNVVELIMKEDAKNIDRDYFRASPDICDCTPEED